MKKEREESQRRFDEILRRMDKERGKDGKK
jgi:hypothetical protein